MHLTFYPYLTIKFSYSLTLLHVSNRFVNHFHKISPLSTEEAKVIGESMDAQHFKKGTILLREGQVAVEHSHVQDGQVCVHLRVRGAR